MSEIKLHKPEEYHGEELCPCCGAGAVTGWHYVNCAKGGYTHRETCAIYQYADLICQQCEEAGEPIA